MVVVSRVDEVHPRRRHGDGAHLRPVDARYGGQQSGLVEHGVLEAGVQGPPEGLAVAVASAPGPRHGGHGRHGDPGGRPAPPPEGHDHARPDQNQEQHPEEGPHQGPRQAAVGVRRRPAPVPGGRLHVRPRDPEVGAVGAGVGQEVPGQRLRHQAGPPVQHHHLDVVGGAQRGPGDPGHAQTHGAVRRPAQEELLHPAAVGQQAEPGGEPQRDQGAAHGAAVPRRPQGRPAGGGGGGAIEKSHSADLT